MFRLHALNLCKPQEYGLQCGDIPHPAALTADGSYGAVPPPPQPPAHCRAVGYIAEEDQLVCCPCGS